MDKMRIRRNIAITSFVSILVVLGTTLIMIFFGTEQVGENMLKSTGIISPILLSLTGLIAQYAHTSHQNDKGDQNASLPR